MPTGKCSNYPLTRQPLFRANGDITESHNWTQFRAQHTLGSPGDSLFLCSCGGIKGQFLFCGNRLSNVTTHPSWRQRVHDLKPFEENQSSMDWLIWNAVITSWGPRGYHRLLGNGGGSRTLEGDAT